MKNSGMIFQTDKGEYAVAYNKEQHEAFTKIDKLFVHFFEDSLCEKPMVDKATGKKLVGLKHVSKLRPVGFVD